MVVFIFVLFQTFLLFHLQEVAGVYTVNFLQYEHIEKLNYQEIVYPNIQGRKDSSLHFLLTSEGLVKPRERQEQEAEGGKIFSSS